MNRNSQAIVNELQRTVDQTIASLLGSTQPERAIILDVPDYPNVGDPAIFIGELTTLRRVAPATKLHALSPRSYESSADEEIERSDIIFLQGGGNFGDIWPRHQDFRNTILSRFAHKRIIHFPQSFYFKSEEALQTSQRVIAKAKNLSILARDNKGLDFIQRNFDCHTALCPDMVFGIGPLVAPEPTLDVSCLLRTDQEVLKPKTEAISEILTSSGLSFQINDWTENGRYLERVHGVIRVGRNAGIPPKSIARHGLPLYEMYAKSRLRFGLRLLGLGRQVVTDRLHGHILSTLIGRPQFVFDSLDGKVRAFHDTWLAGRGVATFLDDIADFDERLRAQSEAA